MYFFSASLAQSLVVTHFIAYTHLKNEAKKRKEEQKERRQFKTLDDLKKFDIDDELICAIEVKINSLNFDCQ